jgi:hypothetical protein
MRRERKMGEGEEQEKEREVVSWHFIKLPKHFLNWAPALPGSTAWTLNFLFWIIATFIPIWSFYVCFLGTYPSWSSVPGCWEEDRSKDKVHWKLTSLDS